MVVLYAKSDPAKRRADGRISVVVLGIYLLHHIAG